jgi:hypothetical protein
MSEKKKKRTIVVKDTENGAVRITVSGPPYPMKVGADLDMRTCEIRRDNKIDFRVGRAVLHALRYGVVVDLHSWPEVDPLPIGLPRCDYSYLETTSEGWSRSVRCTNEATVKVHVTELRHEGNEYDAKVCAACMKRESAAGKEPDPFDCRSYKVEIKKKGARVVSEETSQRASRTRGRRSARKSERERTQ